MGRWLFRSKRRDERAAARDGKRVEHKSARSKTRGSKTRHRDRPAPLTWNDSQQDFITRYGDPFDD